jgi:hypothetical protein
MFCGDRTTAEAFEHPAPKIRRALSTRNDFYRVRAMQRLYRSIAAVSALFCVATAPGAAAGYPTTLTAHATLKSGVTTITSVLTIKVNSLMPPLLRTRAVDGLKYNGYPGFVNALRPLPVIGQISSQNGSVDIRYAWETKVDGRRQLILVADKPLFFLANDPAKPRAGYELTVVDLSLDDRDMGTGSMAGAARVKPAPDGGVILDDYATSLVQLTIEPAAK